MLAYLQELLISLAHITARRPLDVEIVAPGYIINYKRRPHMPDVAWVANNKHIDNNSRYNRKESAAHTSSNEQECCRL